MNPYDAIMTAIHLTTGLDQSQIIRAQFEGGGPVPALPFITVQITHAMAVGRPYWDGDVLKNTFDLDVSINVFAATHEDAMRIVSLWQCCMPRAARDVLSAAGLALWAMPEVRDLTERLDTGYQPRIYVRTVLGSAMSIDDARDVIESATVTGP